MSEAYTFHVRVAGILIEEGHLLLVKQNGRKENDGL